jgi:hypothetical protein
MPVIAPWITANNPLEYMKAGAGLGLQARAEGNSMADAANRLRFSYDQLSANQDMERRRMQQEAAATSAADALRQQQQNALMQYRQQEIANQQEKTQTAAQTAAEALAAKGDYEGSLMDYRDRALAENTDLRGQTLDAKQAQLDATTRLRESHEAAVKIHQDAEDQLKRDLEQAKEESAAARRDSEGKDKAYVDILDPSSTTGPKANWMHQPMNSPLINSTLGTNAPPGTGTNFPGAALRQSTAQPTAAPIAAALPVPANPQERRPGAIYQTAKGPMRWVVDKRTGQIGWGPAE